MTFVGSGGTNPPTAQQLFRRKAGHLRVTTLFFWWSSGGRLLGSTVPEVTTPTDEDPRGPGQEPLEYGALASRFEAIQGGCECCDLLP